MYRDIGILTRKDEHTTFNLAEIDIIISLQKLKKNNLIDNSWEFYIYEDDDTKESFFYNGEIFLTLDTKYEYYVNIFNRDLKLEYIEFLENRSYNSDIIYIYTNEKLDEEETLLFNESFENKYYFKNLNYLNIYDYKISREEWIILTKDLVDLWLKTDLKKLHKEYIIYKEKEENKNVKFYNIKKFIEYLQCTLIIDKGLKLEFQEEELRLKKEKMRLWNEELKNKKILDTKDWCDTYLGFTNYYQEEYIYNKNILFNNIFEKIKWKEELTEKEIMKYFFDIIKNKISMQKEIYYKDMNYHIKKIITYLLKDKKFILNSYKLHKEICIISKKKLIFLENSFTRIFRKELEIDTFSMEYTNKKKQYEVEVEKITNFFYKLMYFFILDDFFLKNHDYMNKFKQVIEVSHIFYSNDKKYLQRLIFQLLMIFCKFLEFERELNFLYKNLLKLEKNLINKFLKKEKRTEEILFIETLFNFKNYNK